MVFYCTVPCCKKSNKITKMHSFPKDIQIYKIWLNNIKNNKLYDLIQEEVIRNYRVCHEHFESKYHLIGRCGANLRLNSIPTLNLPSTSCLGIGTKDEFAIPASRTSSIIKTYPGKRLTGDCSSNSDNLTTNSKQNAGSGSHLPSTEGSTTSNTSTSTKLRLTGNDSSNSDNLETNSKQNADNGSLSPTVGSAISNTPTSAELTLKRKCRKLELQVKFLHRKLKIKNSVILKLKRQVNLFRKHIQCNKLI